MKMESECNPFAVKMEGGGKGVVKKTGNRSFGCVWLVPSLREKGFNDAWIKLASLLIDDYEEG